MKHHEATGSDP